MRFIFCFFLCLPGLLDAQSLKIPIEIPWNQDFNSVVPPNGLDWGLKPGSQPGDTVLVLKIPLPHPGKLAHPDFEQVVWLPMAPQFENRPGFSEGLPGVLALHTFKVRYKTYVCLEILVSRSIGEGITERVLGFELVGDVLPEEDHKTLDAVSHSVLATGYWVKIGVETDGVYFVSNQSLLDEGFASPGAVHLFGNEHGMLPESNNKPSPDDLVEIPVIRTDSGFFFYGKSPHAMGFASGQILPRPQKNLFDNRNYYFLSADHGQGLEIPSFDSQGLVPDTTISSLWHGVFWEPDTINLLRSGKDWLSYSFSTNTLFQRPIVLDSWVPGTGIQIQSRVLARSANPVSFSWFVDDNPLEDIFLPAIIPEGVTTDYASQASISASFLPLSPVFPIRFQFNRPANSPQTLGWLDYFSVYYNRYLELTGRDLSFNTRGVGSLGNVLRLLVQGPASMVALDVTSPLQPVKLLQEPQTRWQAMVFQNDTTKDFILFNTDSCALPIFFGKVPNQDVHGTPPCDLLIVTDPAFFMQSVRLAAFHQSEGLECEIVTTSQIYNEFSTGRRDPAAIRNFARLLYERGIEDEPGLDFLLLFGDGSYDNLRPDALIPTYQSSASLKLTETYVSDDFFGLLDWDEGGGNGLLDIGIGRLPVMNESEARDVVDKILSYSKAESAGHWTRTLTFLADDEDSNIHVQQADSLASFCQKTFQPLSIQKIFLDGFVQEETGTGDRYPEARQMLARQVDEGLLICNYTGHGSEAGLTGEQVITAGDVQNWSNGPRYPLFITATCEFSRFDDPDNVSAGELVLLNPNGGGIALLSTTRLSFSTPNFIMNLNFFRTLSETPEGQAYLGALLMKTKNRTGFGANQRNFTLLGDPALRLKSPPLEIEMDSVQTTPVTGMFEPGSTVTISGSVVSSIDKNKVYANGTVSIRVFGKEILRRTLGNDDGTPFFYSDQGVPVWEGSASLTDGVFNASFVVPLSQMGTAGLGKVLFFFQSDLGWASGSDSLVFGGLPGPVKDLIGPTIEMEISHVPTLHSSFFDETGFLQILLSDSSGIDPGFSGIGHDILLTLDGDRANSVILNQDFVPVTDDYRQGSIAYPLPDLSAGIHSFEVTAWDVMENNSKASFVFETPKALGVRIQELDVFPNPAFGSVSIHLELSSGEAPLHVQGRILNGEGKLVRSLTFKRDSASVPFVWDLTDNMGKRCPAGLYLVQVQTAFGEDQVASHCAKLMVLN